MGSQPSSNYHRLEDYSPPNWLTPEATFRFDLDPSQTLVQATYTVVPNGSLESELFFHGESLEFLSLRIQGRICEPDEYQIEKEGIRIFSPPKEPFEITLENRISPNQNLSLEGLYQSGSMLCTQNEPEGFRKITYSIDRPDNMMRAKVTLVGDPSIFPVLLSNGNLISETILPDGRKSVVWEDPFPKPSYLFALVAGDLVEVVDYYKTKSGREITLKIFVQKGNQSKVGFALQSLKKAMRWDEDTFGLEYDLDLYMIVAVHDFNMGAMENKGLNIFNAKLVLADKSSATDETFESILGVVGHEYFHNWTGNRVTLRNWFQLTLKEGLTVFRDQWFTEDMTDKDLKRIQDILFLLEYQFPEDNGPMSHPILPKVYSEMNNFYTVTVYEKGAEVIRLVSEILGREKFKLGLIDYLTKNDGKAVTYEEFLSSMEWAHGSPIQGLRNWYHRKGTPKIEIEEEYFPEKQLYSVKYSDPNANEFPLVFCNSYAVFSPEGNLVQEGSMNFSGDSMVWEIPWNHPDKKAPIISHFRGLSSPVQWKKLGSSMDQSAFLSRFETNGVARFFAFRSFFMQEFRRVLHSDHETNWTEIQSILAEIFHSELDGSYVSFFLNLPSISTISQTLEYYDYPRIANQRLALMQYLSKENRQVCMDWVSRYVKIRNTQEKTEIAKRRLRGTAIRYLLYHPTEDFSQIALQLQKDANHLSEELPILRSILEVDAKEKNQSIELFYQKWKNDSLVLDAWFSALVSFGENAVKTAESLENHPAFVYTNPNKARALFYSLARNSLSFHKVDGSGYAYLSQKIQELDKVNPQVAAGLAKLFANVPSDNRTELSKKYVLEIYNLSELSKDLREVVVKILKMDETMNT